MVVWLVQQLDPVAVLNSSQLSVSILLELFQQLGSDIAIDTPIKVCFPFYHLNSRFSFAGYKKLLFICNQKCLK